MRRRKVPMRKSIVSNQMFPKKELLRIAKNKKGIISIDPTGKAPGRGAYIALDLTEVKKARAKRVIDRTFAIPVEEKFYGELEAYVEYVLARRELFKRMMNKAKILNLLGLAMRAGKIVTGESLVIELIRTGKVNLVFLASDSGVNTSKKVTDKAKFYGIEIIDLFTSDELSQAIGKARKVLAVSDKGFAENLMKLKQVIRLTLYKGEGE